MKQTEKKYITLNRINLNAGLKALYEKKLLNLVKLMADTYTKELLKIFKAGKQQLKDIKYAQDAKNDKDKDISQKVQKSLNKLNETYTKYFTKKGKEESQTIFDKLEKDLKKQMSDTFYAFFASLAMTEEETKLVNKPFKKFIEQFSPNVLSNKEKFLKAFTLNAKPFSDITEQIKRTTIMNNVELIKSIHQQYHREVSQSVYDCIVNGKGISILEDKLSQCGAKTKRRAKLIARDQINKAHNILQLQELKQAGLKKAIWNHIGGGKTDRKTHISYAPTGINRTVFDITKGAYDPAVKQYIMPGELPFCRCTAVGIVEIG